MRRKNDIRRAYKEKSLKFHPDKYLSADEKLKAKNEFINIGKAYEILKALREQKNARVICNCFSEKEAIHILREALKSIVADKIDTEDKKLLLLNNLALCIPFIMDKKFLKQLELQLMSSE